MGALPFCMEVLSGSPAAPEKEIHLNCGPRWSRGGGLGRGALTEFLHFAAFWKRAAFRISSHNLYSNEGHLKGVTW